MFTFKLEQIEINHQQKYLFTITKDNESIYKSKKSYSLYDAYMRAWIMMNKLSGRKYIK